MRKWYKYILNYENNLRLMPKDSNYDDFKKTMGYDSDIGYGSKEEFFRVHFYNAHPRFRHYDNYLRKNLEKGKEILSIGSGRCINELLLMKDGFNIICSDIDLPCREKTLGLFPDLRFVKYDVKSSPFGHKFDAIICLCVFYSFNEDELLRVFKNASGSLKSGGKFIFDPGGAVNNIFTYINDEMICKFETNLLYIIQKVRQRECVVVKIHQGYRSKNEEIISVARRADFSLHGLECSEYSTEIRRSLLLNRLPMQAADVIGRLFPYVRMFTFVKDG